MIARAFSLAVAVLTSVALAALAFMLFLEVPPIVYRNIPFPVLVDSIKAGNSLPVKIDICVLPEKQITYTVTRSLRNVANGQYTFLPDVVVRGIPGCRTGTSMINQIPLGTVPGRYVVIGLTIAPGLIRDFSIPWETVEFEVVQ